MLQQPDEDRVVAYVTKLTAKNGLQAAIDRVARELCMQEHLASPKLADLQRRQTVLLGLLDRAVDPKTDRLQAAEGGHGGDTGPVNARAGGERRQPACDGCPAAVKDAPGAHGAGGTPPTPTLGAPCR
jgi:hypothetical protein